MRPQRYADQCGIQAMYVNDAGVVSRSPRRLQYNSANMMAVFAKECDAFGLIVSEKKRT